MKNHQSHLYLQADDRLYVNIGDTYTKSNIDLRNTTNSNNENDSTKSEHSSLPYNADGNGDNIVSSFTGDNDSFMSMTNNIGDGKHWIVLPLPATYSATNWPIRVIKMFIYCVC